MEVGIIIIVILIGGVIMFSLLTKAIIDEDKPYWKAREETERFKFGMKVRDIKFCMEGTVVDIDSNNCNGPGCGPIPYVMVKNELGVTKRYPFGDGLEIIKE